MTDWGGEARMTSDRGTDTLHTNWGKYESIVYDLIMAPD